MRFVAIPLAVLNAPEFQALKYGDQKLLVDLYVLFADCQRFCIDLDRPQDYRQTPGISIARRLQQLLAAGLLVVDGAQQTGPRHTRRVFAFKHPAFEVNRIKEPHDG